MSETEYPADPESYQSVGPPHRNQDADTYGGYTVLALRSSILSKIGKRGDWGTPFTREELNALHGAITGEYIVPKRHLYRPDHEEWASRQFMLAEVAAKVGIWEPDDPVWGTNVESPDQFRKYELVQIREKLSETGNKMVERLRERGDVEQ